MSGVAYNGSTIAQSTESGYVTYSIETWQQISSGYCSSYNPDPPYECTNYVQPVYGWVYSGSGSTGAKITGSVSASSSVYVNGMPIASIGSQTNETWIADPPIPSSDSSTRYTATSPTSGSGSGSIPSGNLSNVYVGGNSVAMIGSSVTTNLGNATTINSGSSSVFIG